MTAAQTKRGIERALAALGTSRSEARARIASITASSLPATVPPLDDVDDADVKALVTAMLG